MTAAVAEKAEKKPAKKPEKKKEEKDVLKLAIDALHEKEGEESLRVGLTQGVLKCDSYSTRCLPLDLALGVGGVARGRVTEIFGPESSGKTTLAATIVAEAQSRGDTACYIDAEHAIDPDYIARIGVDLDKLLFSQPDSGEQAFRIIEKLLDTNKVGIIVIDSVPALVTAAELAGEAGDHFVAEQARLISLNLRRLIAKIHSSMTAVIFLNQLREKAGQRLMPGQSSEQTPGGRALKFYSSQRIDIRRIGSIKEGETAVANTTRAKIVKNKVAPPFKQAVFDIRFGEGIDTLGSILDMAVLNKFIAKSGSNYSYNDQKIAGSKKDAIAWMGDNAPVVKELDGKLRELLFSKLIEGEPVPTLTPEALEGESDKGEEQITEE
jgi:recombination protein RecA